MELLENTGINKHTIDLIDEKEPPYRLIYTFSPIELETLKAYIKTHLNTWIIGPCKSSAGTPILFVKNPDGSFCLCVDYPGPNNLTIKNWYPLLLISESLDWLGRAKRFTQLDLISAYHQMRIWEGYQWKITFRTRYGHFENQVMPFRLSNALTSIKGYINKILFGKLNIFVLMYLDDILIYTKDPDRTHMETVHWILDQRKKYKAFVNLKTYRCHQNEVRFLGFVVLAQGIRMEEKGIKAVKTWPEPQLIRDIQVFIDFANFYCCFIKDCSKIIALLISILKTTTLPAS